MEIPLQTKVMCTDGLYGRSAYVLINPVAEKVTHVVVREDSSQKEYIVPLEMISETDADMIQLRCSKAALEKMEPFIETTFIKEEVPSMNVGYGMGGMYGMGGYYYMPYTMSPKTEYVPVETEQIPPGELAVRRGTHVAATDGRVGRVDEFVVNPENGHITHLVMREGHLWGQKEVTIPISAMENVHDDTVFLKLNKQQIEALPTVPLHRHWA